VTTSPFEINVLHVNEISMFVHDPAIAGEQDSADCTKSVLCHGGIREFTKLIKMQNLTSTSRVER
jgi:hypothetical protein